MTINPLHIPVALRLKRVRLVRGEGALATNGALPDIPGLAVRPRIRDQRTVLAGGHLYGKRLCLRRGPCLAVVDVERGAEEVLDDLQRRGDAHGDGVGEGDALGDGDGRGRALDDCARQDVPAEEARVGAGDHKADGAGALLGGGGVAGERVVAGEGREGCLEGAGLRGDFVGFAEGFEFGEVGALHFGVAAVVAVEDDIVGLEFDGGSCGDQDGRRGEGEGLSEVHVERVWWKTRNECCLSEGQCSRVL
jgi:hypothetical protein